MPAEAVRWFRLAAEQGMAGSQSMLATMYEKGLGVGADPAEAAKWRERRRPRYFLIQAS